MNIQVFNLVYQGIIKCCNLINIELLMISTVLNELFMYLQFLNFLYGY